MGILKALFSATSSVTKDQWKGFFMCNSIPDDTLMVRGLRRKNPNDNGDLNVITDGSIYTLADGQAAIVTSQGKVVCECTEPGEHVYKSDLSKGVFSEGGLEASIKEIGRRFSYGGDIPTVERIYYVNTKLISGGVISSCVIPIRFVDQNTGADVDLTLSCAGTYCFRIASPGKFYSTVAGNVSSYYKKYEVIGMMNKEFTSILMQAVSDLTKAGKRSYELSAIIPQLENILIQECSKKWMELRGIEIESVAFSEFRLTGNDQSSVAAMQMLNVLKDPSMAAASLVSAQSDAMRAAAENKN